ncbi:MAG: cell division protein SepF [Huintestinicola sp.]
MGFLDNFRTALGIDGGDDNYDNEYDQPQEEISYNNGYGRNQNGPYNNQYGNAPADDNGRNRVVNISATAQLQVILVKPEKFQDTKEIANHLNNKKTVVLNLEATTPDITRRIIDFLGGVAYANGGSIKPVANNTFIITPYNVGFQGDELAGELESNGVFL